MSNKPEKYLPGRPCRDCEQTEPKVVGGVLMEPNGNSTIRQIVENVMMSLGANNHDFRLRDKLITENAHYIQRHSDALSASLERERVLRKALSYLHERLTEYKNGEAVIYTDAAGDLAVIEQALSQQGVEL